MPYATRGDTRISYSDTGTGDPALIFSHGLLMDRSMFDPQVAAFRDRHRCLAWDERGHGATEATDDFTYWDSAEDLVAVLDDAGVDRAVLVGMSQGGFLSLRTALLHPERVVGLFLIDSQAGTENPGALPVYEAMLAAWAQNGLEDHVAEAIAAAIMGAFPADEWKEKWRARPIDQVRRAFHTLTTREDVTDRLGEIRVPAAVVHGDADASIPLERARALADGLPLCEGLTVIPGGGHASNLSHPNEVNRALEAFLESLGS
ncbi:MAG TPA: alpha/beta hydrolase [Actinomycetota bacterium]|nr:alpha/beta hydrolase [Actinomycetota bacterium]